MSTLAELVADNINRGIMALKDNKIDVAIMYFNKAIEVMPNSAEAYYNRGNAYAHKNMYDQAIADYTKAIELKNGYAQAYHNRGIALRNKGQNSLAIANFSRACILGYQPACEILKKLGIKV